MLVDGGAAGSGSLAREGQPLPLLPGQQAPAMHSKQDCGRQEAVPWASKEYLLLSVDVILPLYKHTASLPVHTRFNLTGYAE